MYQISRHQVAILATLGDTGYKTAAQIAKLTGVSGRTVREHLMEMTAISILEMVPVFGGYQYRLKRERTKEQQLEAFVYLKELAEAAKIFDPDESKYGGLRFHLAEGARYVGDPPPKKQKERKAGKK